MWFVSYAIFTLKRTKEKEAKKGKHLNMKHDTLAALIYSKEEYESKFVKNLNNLENGYLKWCFLRNQVKYLTGCNYIQVHRYFLMYALFYNATLIIINIILFTGTRQLSKYTNNTYLQITMAGGARFASDSEKKKEEQNKVKIRKFRF